MQQAAHCETLLLLLLLHHLVLPCFALCVCCLPHHLRSCLRAHSCSGGNLVDLVRSSRACSCPVGLRAASPPSLSSPPPAPMAAAGEITTSSKILRFALDLEVSRGQIRQRHLTFRFIPPHSFINHTIALPHFPLLQLATGATESFCYIRSDSANVKRENIPNANVVRRPQGI